MAELPYQTLAQFIGLGLTLLAGWLFGLASRSGGGKWRERYQDEAVDHANYRDRAESELREAAARVRALEAEIAGRKRVTPATPDDRPAEASDGAWRGWFGWGRDNLSRIDGVDEARERRLNELGIKTYREIEKMTAEDESALEQRLGIAAGEIAAKRWREQAALLRAGNEDEHARRFG